MCGDDYVRRVEVDLLGPDPIYLQIAAVVRDRIERGEYEPDRAVPSEMAMCEEFEVSRNTVRRAIAQLNEEGVLRTVRGKGSYVVPH
jgi:DNA-binding GntR family transcriptional regulator